MKREYLCDRLTSAKTASLIVITKTAQRRAAPHRTAPASVTHSLTEAVSRSVQALELIEVNAALLE